MISRTIGAVAAATGLLFLAACGGGGGGGGVSPSAGGSPDPSPTPAGTVSEFRDAARSEVFGQLDDVRVSFGSVAVATGARVTGIDPSFDGERVSAVVERGSAPTIRIDSTDAYYDLGTEASTLGLPNRSSRTRATFAHSASSATLGLIAVNWSNDDPGDYLAGGYWLHMETDPFGLEIGAFIDGPELDLDDPPALPVAGSARYRGAAGGMYAVRYGSDGGAVPEGSEELGEFSGIATLTADFDAGTIDGCIGCAGNVLLSGVHYDKSTGGTETFIGVPTGYRVNLGTVNFDRSNATFQGGNVTLFHPVVPITRSSGTWAGQFSNRLNGSGDPQLVAGTFGGEGSTGGGSRAVFVGAFAAGSR